LTGTNVILKSIVFRLLFIVPEWKPRISRWHRHGIAAREMEIDLLHKNRASYS
jgi:hypothetical protein